MSGGRHVKILGSGCPDKLNDPSGIHSFLLSSIELVGMRRLMGPHTCSVDLQLAKMKVEPFEDEGGVTGVVVLSTSHAAIHTWPLRKYFVFDMYSCRSFDERLIEIAMVQALGAYNLKTHDLSVALDYPYRAP